MSINVTFTFPAQASCRPQTAMSSRPGAAWSSTTLRLLPQMLDRRSGLPPLCCRPHSSAVRMRWNVFDICSYIESCDMHVEERTLLRQGCFTTCTLVRCQVNARKFGFFAVQACLALCWHSCGSIWACPTAAAALAAARLQWPPPAAAQTLAVAPPVMMAAPAAAEIMAPAAPAALAAQVPQAAVRQLCRSAQGMWTASCGGRWQQTPRQPAARRPRWRGSCAACRRWQCRTWSATRSYLYANSSRQRVLRTHAVTCQRTAELSIQWWMDKVQTIRIQLVPAAYGAASKANQMLSMRL